MAKIHAWLLLPLSVMELVASDVEIPDWMLSCSETNEELCKTPSLLQLSLVYSETSHLSRHKASLNEQKPHFHSGAGKAANAAASALKVHQEFQNWSTHFGQLETATERLEPPVQSIESKFAFLSVYSGFFVMLILAVHLTTRLQSLQEKSSRQSKPAQSNDSSQPAPLEVVPSEVTHGQPVNFPYEPVVEQFLKNSSDIPNRAALVACPLSQERYEVTFKDLASKVQILAQKLQCLSVEKGAIVVLALDRGVHQLAAVYATMLCGAAWVPIDPAVPEQRFKEVLQDTKPALLIHQEDTNGLQVASWSEAAGVHTAVALLDASDIRGKIKNSKVAEQRLKAKDMRDMALIIYTSGTTGKPKGIMYSHAMLNHGSHAIADLMEMRQDSIAFLKTPYIWAVVEWELFPSLLRGGTLVVGSGTAHKDPQYMSKTILEERVTCLVMAPDVLDLLLDVHEQGSQLQSLKHVISVGAGLPVALANRFMQMRQLSAQLHNVYGASESSCTVWTVPDIGVDTRLWSNRAPVGVPQMGCTVWLLDDQLRKVQAGKAGEICFGGQLSLGYFKLPELTAEKFIAHPDLGVIYRTGDLARWRAGVLEICGRRDRQVKIRGVRVEPEEVESTLKTFRPASHEDISLVKSKSLKHVACVATSGPSPELVAFVSPILSETEISQAKQHLATCLPPYYLPKFILSQAELPLLPNEKVNLHALVEEADKYLETNAGEMMMDSLGRMRNMSRGAILEQQVIHRCYTFWMLGVIIDHWNFCGLSGRFCVVPNKPGIVPPWIELFIRQIGNDQDMFGFIMLGALQDSRMQPGETKSRMKLGYADFFCFLLYLLMGFPLPQLLSHIFKVFGEWAVHYHIHIDVNPTCSENWPTVSCSAHRWYLFMVVWVHLCIACCQVFKIPGWLQVLWNFALCVFAPTTYFDPCSMNIPTWLKWVCCWILPYAKVTKDLLFGFETGNHTAECPVMQSWMQWYALFYIFAFHYSRPGMKLITNAVNRLGCNTAPCAIAALGLSSVAGAALAMFHYPNEILDQAEFLSFERSELKWWFAPLEISVSMFQPLLFAFAMAWFPFNLSWSGNTTLGTYIIHFYFMGYIHAAMGNALELLEPVKGLPQLLYLLACPIAFMTTLGPFFHYLLLAPSFVARKVGLV